MGGRVGGGAVTLPIDVCDRRAMHRLEEYKLLVGRWETWDTRSLAIKGWASAGMIVALPGLATSPTAAAPLAAMVLAISIMLLEAYWRTFQGSDQDRMLQLERLADDREPNAKGLRIGRHAAVNRRRVYRSELRRRWRFAPRKPNMFWLALWTLFGNLTIWLPYFPFAVICMALAMGFGRTPPTTPIIYVTPAIERGDISVGITPPDKPKTLAAGGQ